MKTPGLIAATSRGVVPHLSRDHVKSTAAIRWVHIPFETFLDHNPPVPTIQTGAHALHRFLGFVPSQHILSFSARDPSDERELPTNGKDYISTYCIRGVRKLTPSSWCEYAAACKPDLVIALSDTPFTPPPHSQKRLTKSIERSAAWLADVLAWAVSTTPGDLLSADRSSTAVFRYPRNVLVHMAGGVEVHARRKFANSLIESLETREAARLTPLGRLDDGVAGYVFDLVPLRRGLAAQSAGPSNATPADLQDEMHQLLRASLEPLPRTKPRIVNSTGSPHEVLRSIRHVGVDLFDAYWAQRAADIGVALDFYFPVPEIHSRTVPAPHDAGCPTPKIRPNGKRDLGHNLYSAVYAHDHSRVASSLIDAASHASLIDAADTSYALPVCPCAACSPRPSSTRLHHSVVDVLDSDAGPHPVEPPYTRSYIHHLLHTHEMSSHSLLVMHNLAVLDAFFAGVRAVLAGADGIAEFDRQVDRFMEVYDEEMAVFEEAAADWLQVDLARGKGRLAREKAKQESTLGTAVDV
ncbi:tRNA-guanine(15) transglycosylase-like protein [Sparassis latifolia]